MFYGCAISIDGKVSYFQRGSNGVKGGGLYALAEDESKRLNQLIGHLPDDNSTLPPLGRRIVLQVATGNSVLARVYDRANAPVEILDILRLTQSRVKSWAKSFEPQSKWTAGDFSFYGGFGLSADGTQIISAGAEATLI